MVRIAAEQVRRAGFATAITCEEAEPINTAGGPWDAILCAFALPRLADRLRVLTSWSQALDTRGKVAVSVWGPDEPGDPVDFLKKSLRQEAGSGMFTEPPFPTDRQAMARLFDEVGLELVRHTVVQHTISFRSTEEFASALVEGAGWNDAFARLDEEGRHRALVRFYDAMGGPDAPLVYRACATIAVACRPGADVEVEAVPSLRILPVAPDSNPSGGLL
jgi:hypothetical protein